MNFMPGFYEEAVTGGSRSSSSSSHRTHLPSYTYGGGGGGGRDETPDDSSEDHNSMLLMRVGSGEAVQKEHMFDKVVTPSDVGKLNRLVIPKQHAEKYFPLDSSSNDKGLLLNFEDRNGKPWRFRYSYWNSSQSYVMTKGWSRFVKEKKLDAGDIVSFHRGADDSVKDRLFIDWRRRPDAPHDPHHHFSSFAHHRPPNPWGPLFMQQQQQLAPPHPPPQQQHHHQYSHCLQSHNYHPYGGPIVNGSPCPPGSIMYLRSTTPGVGGPGSGRGVLAPGPKIHEMEFMDQQQQQQQQQHVMMSNISRVGHNNEAVFESVPVVVQGKPTAATKRLRLFGVNMDCPTTSSSPHSHDHHLSINNNNINNNNYYYHTNNQNNMMMNECDVLMASSTLPLIHDHPNMMIPMTMMTPFDSSTSSSSMSSLARLRHREDEDDKGKGSISLDLDI